MSLAIRPEDDEERGVRVPMSPGGPLRDATFEEFVAARGRWIERVAFLLTGDPHLAQDLTQLTLVQVYRNWSRVSSADQPDAYVRRILVNQLRSQQRRRAWNELLVEEPLERGGVGTGSTIDGVDERLRLQGYLRALTPRARAVIVLRYFENLDVREVASILGINPSTVRATASRTLDKLADLIRKEKAP